VGGELRVARMGKLVKSGVGESWDCWDLDLQVCGLFQAFCGPGIV
jgi:hypothetical protein